MDTIVTLDPIDVFCLSVESGPAGWAQAMPAAWSDLEGRLPTLRGRKFYGVYQHSSGAYRVCVQVEASDPEYGYGLERWTIPGGRYARRKLPGWQADPEQIPSTFAEMVEQNTPDPNLPSIEHYRSQQEAILYLGVM